MSLEKGDAKDLSSEKSNQDINKELMINMQLMQKELAELKKGNNTQQNANAPAGLTADQMAAIMAAAIKAAKTQPDAIMLADSFVNERDIDKDDFDKDGVVFCAYNTGYFIVDDKRQGFSVRTPFGNVLHFKFQGQTKTRDVNGKEVLNTFSAYLSRSKKEQEWLRDHSFFEIKFFESAKEALSTDGDRAQRLARFINVVMGMEQNEIVKNCHSYGVPINNNIRGMRKALASKMLDAVEAKEGGRVEVSATQSRLKDAYEDDLFLGGGKSGGNLSPVMKNF